jgi:uncharacterized membrane protein
VSTIVESIVVDVPVTTAYNQWTQFESFPDFMQGVERVEQLDDTHLHWEAAVAGQRVEWDAEIVEQAPDRRIAWTSVDGRRNAGMVSFHRVNDTQTRIQLRMAYEAEGKLETLADALGLARRSVRGNLERFKRLIETRGVETGAWRGEVAGDDAPPPAP